MYNEKLEELIDAALADGVLTEKEKQVLFKKAQEMGIDLDEFEMVLDSRLVKLKKSEERKAQSSAPKSNKLGDVKKCPACGAIVQSYQGACHECGYAFENIDANSTAKKLADELMKIDKQYIQIKNERLSEVNDGCLSQLSIPPVKKLREKLEEARLNREQNKAKAQVIKTIAIPSTKADLVEFITTLSVRMVERSEDKRITDAYSLKNKECITKADLLFPNDSTFNTLKNDYTEANKKWQKQRNWKLVRHYGPSVLLITALIVVPIITKSIRSSQQEEEQTKIEQLKTLLDNGDIESAKLLFDQEFSTDDEIRKIMYNAYINNGLYDEASVFVPTDPEDYYLYMEEVVNILTKTNSKSEAKKFIKRKIPYFYQYDDDSKIYHDKYNSKLVEERLNAIINNL